MKVDKLEHVEAVTGTFFNSRPLVEVDAFGTSLTDTEYAFQLTTSRGGRHFTGKRKCTGRYFQLTTSRGGRRILRTTPTARRFFNSRPLVEVDREYTED